MHLDPQRQPPQQLQYLQQQQQQQRPLYLREQPVHWPGQPLLTTNPVHTCWDIHAADMAASQLLRSQPVESPRQAAAAVDAAAVHGNACAVEPLSLQ